ncbi:MAG: ABC transporter permease [Clostridiales bacterium]|nr:ABC transporter permease [Clostridiales bacterium]
MMKKFHIRGIYVLVILYVIGVSIYNPAFMTANNWLNIIRSVAVYGIMSCGITFVMLTGRTELSAGMMITFLAAISCYFIIPGMDNQFLAIVMPLILGTVFGAFNGFLVGILKLNSFVATMGMMSIFTGAILLFMKSVPSLNGNIENSVYRFIGQGSILKIPMPAVIFAVVAIICSIILRKTVYGARVYAVGSNAVSARFSGINATRIIVSTYIISGFLTGLGALVMCSRIMSAQPKMGTGYEFTALTAIVLGGLSIMGGKGTILGTVFGVLILGIIDNSFTLLGVNPYLQYVVMGIILIVAVSAQLLGERRKKL